MACTMSQFPNPFVVSMPPYIDSQYAPTNSSSMMSSTSPRDHSRSSPQTISLSPSSSQGEHRVSKAKKGKRVHACEYPGCEKVFTRAEHRRRHELSHKYKKLYTCPHKGCSNAFQRADYLSQHIVRHDTEPTMRSSSVRSNHSASSPGESAQASQAFPSRSPLAGFQSPSNSTDKAAPGDADHPTTFCPQYTGCQHLSQKIMPESCIYNYPAGMSHNPVTTVGLGISTQPATSTIPVAGLEMVIDQHLRSVLRPEAFLAPPQPPEHGNASFWSSSIDPGLSQIYPAAFQNTTTCPSWTSVPDPVLSDIPDPQQLYGTPPTAENKR